MPAKETGKQRAIRVPLDYFRHGDRLQRGKAMLGVLALVLSIVWVGVGFLSGEGRYSRGPVARVHAAWDDNCQACHVAFTPIRDAAWTAPLLGHSTESSARCQTCHAGPPHHQGQTPDLACADCHHDHQGRTASLVHLADSDCTRCHADMDKHVTAATKLQYKKDITVFAQGSHPDFRSVSSEDPGRLKFNHKLHMALGLSLEKGGKPFTLGDIATTERERYRRDQGTNAKPGDAVQLQCASCHRLDRGDFGQGDAGAARPARDAGAYMLPINYDNQCKGCHPLTLRGPKAGAELVIPHRLQPEQVRDFLWGALAHQQLEMKPWTQPANRPLPGKTISEQVQKEIKEDIKTKVEKFLYKDKLADAEKVLYWGKQTCGECHHYTSAAAPGAMLSRRELPGPAPASSGRESMPAAVVPPRLPDVWYQHARFNHGAHKAVACVSCHTKAESSTKANDVLIPKIDNCVQCHAPRTTAGGKVMGGVDYGCTECHVYHHRDREAAFLQGMGSKAREPGTRVSVEDFLSGRGARPQAAGK